MRLYITLTFIVILLIVAFIFGSQNNQEIALNYLIAQQQMTVAFAVSLFTMIGVVLGVLFSILWRLTAINRKKRKQLVNTK